MNKITFKDVAHMYMGREVQFEAFKKDEETGEAIDAATLGEEVKL